VVNATILVIGALKLGVHNPYAALAVSTTEGAELLAFYMFLKPNVEALDALSDQQLQRAAQIAKEVKADVAALIAERKAWRNANASNREPNCPQ
jgi:hypothetical protein